MSIIRQDAASPIPSHFVPFALGHFIARPRNNQTRITPPVTRSPKPGMPASAPADASRLFFSKLALADLVE